MGRLAVTYATDMSRFASWSLPQVQEHVRNLPYILDPQGEEALHRPWITISRHDVPRLGRDCDDKAICMGAWATLQGWPFRFVAAGNGDGRRRPMFHHVFCSILVPGHGWVWADATYSYDRLGTNKPYSNQRVIFTTEARK